MEVRGQHRFTAGRAAVWEALLDPAALRAALPGCETFAEVAPDTYDVTLSVGIAAFKGVYSGRVRVEQRQPRDSYHLAVEGTGRPGRVQGGAVLSLRDDGGATIVEYAGEVKVQGTLARLGSRIAVGAARLLASQFFKAMEPHVADRVGREQETESIHG